MKRWPALLLCLLLALPLAAGDRGMELKKLRIEGLEKPVLLYVPEGYTPKKAWGLALCLHGTGMHGGHMADAFADELRAVGAAGYLVAFPSSNRKAWGTGAGTGTPEGDAAKGRELKLLRRTIETILKDYSVDDRCVHTYGFSAGTVILALGVGFQSEWDSLKIRSICGNSGGLAGKPKPAKEARAKETAVWILNGEEDPEHAEISRNIHEAFLAGGYSSRYTKVWAYDHGYPLAPVVEMLRWWRELDKGRLDHHPAPGKPGLAGYLLGMALPDSPAGRAGLAPGDLLLSADGKKLETTEDVSRALCDRRQGAKVKLRIRRGNRESEIVLAY